MIRSDADLDFMLKDAGDAVVFGTQSTYGILRHVDQLELGDGSVALLSSTEDTLTIRDGTLTGLVEDAQLTIAGVAYKIRHTGVRLTDARRRIVVVKV